MRHLHPAHIRPARRNRALRLAALAVAMVLLAAAPGRSAGHEPEVLLLSCMDYRLMGDVASYMSGRGLQKEYDHIVLAGGSLGANTDKFPAWGTTFWEHLSIAIDLHKIRRVILMDHRDCGAYKVILGPEHAKDPAVEKATHAEQLQKLKAKVKEKHPTLEVEMLLMSLDGKVVSIP